VGGWSVANYKFQMINFNGVIVCTMNKEFANLLASKVKEESDSKVLAAFVHSVRKQNDLMSKEDNKDG
jgi:hypothetical protein